MDFTFAKLFDFVRRLGLRRQKSPPRSPARPRTLLTLETLEDRFAPASLVQSASFGPAETDWAANLGTFNKFNPTLGTLTRVVVTETANMSFSGDTNKSTSVSETVTVSAALPNGKNLDANLFVSSSVKGPWTLIDSGTASTSFTVAADLAAFSGTGTFVVPTDTVTSLTYSARGQSTLFGTTTTAGVTLTIQYDYTPPAANGAPTVATAAKATPNPVTAKTTSLTVLGADDGGEANLKYTWAVTSAPSGVTLPTFSANGTNAAKNSTATFFAAGSYGFRVTITDAFGLSTTSSTTVTVSQTVTSLAISPTSVSLATGASQQFTATAKDQFGTALVTQPTKTWSLTGIGTLSSTGLYTAPASTTGTASVKVTAGALNSTAAVTVTSSNTAPTVATAAKATPNPVTGTTTNLSVLGADNGGEANLKYTWAITSAPSGAAAPTFSANGTNAAKNSTATFGAAGSYSFRVTIADALGLTTTSSVSVTVSQTLTGLAISPASVSLAGGATQQFTATANDQFGNPLASQPAKTWTLTGIGTLGSTGLYTAPSGSGTATVRVSAGGLSSTADVTVSNNTPAPGISFNAATGALSIHGTQYDDTAGILKVTENGIAKAYVVLIAKNSLGQEVLNQTLKLDVSTINFITFHGYDGVDAFTNYLSVASEAWGGAGNDSLIGGSGTDELYGEAGQDTLKGMDGNDYLDGGIDTDYLFGGPGVDELIPGDTGKNFLTPD